MWTKPRLFKMKHFTFILILFISTQFSFSQSNKQLRKNYWAYFARYSQEELDLIKEHWRESFTEDIFGELVELSDKDIVGRKYKIPEENYESIFCDSYGIIYPAEKLYDSLGKDLFYHKKGYGKTKAKRFHQINNSHVGMFRNLDLDLDENSSYHKIYNDFKRKVSEKDDFISFEDVTAFNDEFNQISRSNLINRIESKLKGKKRVIFFVHGYNVPYSLAAVQAQAMITCLESNHMDMEETLFLPVFWPSNDQKKVKLDGAIEPEITIEHAQFQQNALERNSARIDNLKRISNARRFTYYSNQAYFTAITIRSILNKIESSVVNDSIEVWMISHSLGATVLTSTVINTVEKLDFNSSNPYLSNYIKDKLNSEPIPNFPIKMFMSAPAIPGVSTFSDMDQSIHNKKFFCTVNENDKSLTKKYVKGINLSRNLSATTHGANYNMDAGKVDKMFRETGYYDCYHYSEVSHQVDHNIFSYLLQPGYQEFFSKFVEEKVEW